MIIDSQVHAYEKDSPERPWIGTLHGPPEVTGEQMVAAMDAVNVDAALLVSPWSMYRFDASYALEVYAKHPGRFGLIKPFDPRLATVAEEIAEWAELPSTVAARVMLMQHAQFEVNNAGLKQAFLMCAEKGLPVNILAWGNLELLAELADKYPHTQFILDHLGLSQPFAPPVPEAPFAELSKVLALAQYDNLAIKISGACTLSQQSYPYEDIWPSLQQIFDAFGLHRCMWGTDWTRAVGFLTYAQGVDAFRSSSQLSASDKAQLMGGSLGQIYNWLPGGAKNQR